MCNLAKLAKKLYNYKERLRRVLMGWASGSDIADKIWKAVKPFIKDDERALKKVSKRIYEIFIENDADDWSYQFYEKGSLYETYLRLNEPKEYKELAKELL